MSRRKHSCHFPQKPEAEFVIESIPQFEITLLSNTNISITLRGQSIHRPHSIQLQNYVNTRTAFAVLQHFVLLPRSNIHVLLLISTWTEKSFTYGEPVFFCSFYLVENGFHRPEAVFPLTDRPFLLRLVRTWQRRRAATSFSFPLFTLALKVGRRQWKKISYWRARYGKERRRGCFTSKYLRGK